MPRELRDHWGTLAENLDLLLGQGPKGWGRGGRVMRKAHWAEGTACAKALRQVVCRWCSGSGVSSQRAELAEGTLGWAGRYHGCRGEEAGLITGVSIHVS